MNRFLTANEAADALGVSVSTLYAYVSRGLVRSEAVEGDSRRRRYYAEDIEALRIKKAAAKTPEKLAEAAMHWGTPVMETSITLITAGDLYYRGQRATDLAFGKSFEQVAALIWLADAGAASSLFRDEDHPDLAAYIALYAAGGGLHRLMAVLALAASADLAAYDTRPQAVAETGARVLRLAFSVVAGASPGDRALADHLRQGWCAPEAARLINAALILCADHELNASSFAARVAASTGATVYEAVLAGMAAFMGPIHGGHTQRVHAFVEEIERAGEVRQALGARLRRGDAIPGFGHRVYAHQDPRAAALLAALRSQYPDHPSITLADNVTAHVAQVLGESPTVDFALVMMCRVLAMPPENAMTLFALGRMVGWVGQALEQYTDGRLIRPRATYTGLPPAASL